MDNLRRGSILRLKAHSGLYSISEFRNHEYGIGVCRASVAAETAFFIRKDEIDSVIDPARITE